MIQAGVVVRKVSPPFPQPLTDGRLERSGYARRRRNATDRRRVLIEATELTRRVEGEMFGELIRDKAPLVGT